jgi:hypothetical protein
MHDIMVKARVEEDVMDNPSCYDDPVVDSDDKSNTEEDDSVDNGCHVCNRQMRRSMKRRLNTDVCWNQMAFPPCSMDVESILRCWRGIVFRVKIQVYKEMFGDDVIIGSKEIDPELDPLSI